MPKEHDSLRPTSESFEPPTDTADKAGFAALQRILLNHVAALEILQAIERAYSTGHQP